MDAIHDPSVHTVVLMWAAQTGKTTVLENIIGYFIDQDPSPILMVQPTVAMAQTFSKDRLAPMLRDTPALKGKIPAAKSRDSGNTIEHKRFPGGHFTMTGANAPAALASRPIRVVLMDEVDRYPASSGTEGDPVALAIKRTAAFYNRKIILTSTPTLKGFSRIEQAYLDSDQRRFHISCPECDLSHPLEWANLKNSHDEEGHRVIGTERFECPGCGHEMTEDQRPKLLADGEWVATATPIDPGVVGFHITEDYSVFRHWSEIVLDHRKAKDHPETLKAWTNTSRAETWEVAGDKHDPDTLFDRREHYEAQAPEGVKVITSMTDVQGDRWETEFVGWGYGEESWSLGYVVTHGDTSVESNWAKLLEPVLNRTFESKKGRIKPACSLIDAGYLTDTVYKFCRPRAARMIFPSHGKDGPDKAIVHLFAVPTRKKGSRGEVKPKTVTIGADSAKDLLAAYLNLTEPGPGYCHFPMDYGHNYFEMLTAESRKTKYVRGRPVPFWENPPGRRNEALDCRVGNMAALRLLRVNWEAVKSPTQPKPRRRKKHVPRWKQ